jgi:hypothetical protein
MTAARSDRRANASGDHDTQAAYHCSGGNTASNRPYAFAAGLIAFAAFVASRFMSVAADSTIAPIFAEWLAVAHHDQLCELRQAGSTAHADTDLIVTAAGGSCPSSFLLDVQKDGAEWTVRL